jgi:hypothetical protein
MFSNSNNSTHKSVVQRAAYLLVAALVAASVAAPALAASRPAYVRRPADINKDGVVNSFDLAILLSDYRGEIPTRDRGARSDLNHDGFVNSIDLGILLAEMG